MSQRGKDASGGFACSTRKVEATQVPVHPQVDSLGLVRRAEPSNEKADPCSDTGDSEKPDPGRWTIGSAHLVSVVLQPLTSSLSQKSSFIPKITDFQ